MKKKNPADRPVAEIVDELLRDARAAHTDGPSSPLYGPRAQLSATINQAGSWLAKLDRDEPPRQPSLWQSVLGLSAKTAPKKRSWFFASGDSAAQLTTRRIEQLLRASAKDGVKISFDVRADGGAASDDVHCVLPEGASDPVCEPRKR